MLMDLTLFMSIMKKPENYCSKERTMIDKMSEMLTTALSNSKELTSIEIMDITGATKRHLAVNHIQVLMLSRSLNLKQ